MRRLALLQTLAGTLGLAGSAFAQSVRPATAPLEADRPDFTEASSLVPRGRLQVEAGFTHARGPLGRGGEQTYPEMLLRIGMLAPWFEARLAQTFHALGPAPGQTERRARGADDLYLGAKFGLGDQSGARPQLALVVQGTLPTGHPAFRAHGALSGANLLYGWALPWPGVSVGGSTQANTEEDDAGTRYTELAQSITVGAELTARLGLYGEAYTLSPIRGGGARPARESYLNGGIRLRVTPDLQYDVRIGRGLTDSSQSMFLGVGLVFRR